MQRFHLLAAFVGLLLCVPSAIAQQKNKPIPNVGTVGKITEITQGFKSTGPATANLLGHVFFADNESKEIFLLIPKGAKAKPDDKEGVKAEKLSSFLKLEETCAGITFDPKGRLIVAFAESKQIVAFDLKTKSKTILAEEYDGKAFQAPTGVTVDSKGGVYFSDPPAQSIYYISNDKKVTHLLEKLPAPGAVLVAPNGKTLYVVLQKTPIVMAYVLNAKKPGTLDEKKKDQGRVFCTLKKPEKGGFAGATGATLDVKGKLFIATAAGVQVFDPDGKHLGSISFAKTPLDCAFGGEKRKTLHVTTGKSLFQTKLDIPFDPYPLVLLALGIFCIIFLIVYFRVHAFLALIGAALLVGLLSPNVIFGTDPEFTLPILQILNVPLQTAKAFGDLMGRIGLPIAFATIIGKAMMDSGAADRIVRFFTGLFGEKFAPLALLASGFVLSIPVFFDNVFLLLVPLARALYVRTKHNYLLYVTAIGAGGAVTHSLVPPTPGPIVMSEILHVDLGYTIVIGALVGIPVSLVGFAYAAFINRKMPIELRESGSVSLEELEQQAQVEAKDLPPLWLSFLPILLPVLFITSTTGFDALTKPNSGPFPDWNDALTIGSFVVKPLDLLKFFGTPNIALLIAAVISMLMVFFRKKLTREQLGKFTAEALNDAGMILLITSAGGAFGRMLTNVGVGRTLETLGDRFDIPVLVTAWGLAVLFKVAQGSGTVSMITSAGIVWSIVKAKLDTQAPGQAITAELIGRTLGYHPVYLIMAIGCGSKIASWMNDSGFWVVSKMGGLTEGETLKSWTITLISMGLFGLPLVLFLAWILPLTG